jgi:hypothetical protein
MALHRPVANALTTREVLGPPDRNPRQMHLDQRLLDRTLSGGSVAVRKVCRG